MYRIDSPSVVNERIVYRLYFYRDTTIQVQALKILIDKIDLIVMDCMYVHVLNVNIVIIQGMKFN